MSEKGNANGWLTDDSDDIDLLSLRERIRPPTGSNPNSNIKTTPAKPPSSSQTNEPTNNSSVEVIDLDDDYDDDLHLSSGLLIHRASDGSEGNNLDDYGLEEIEKNGSRSQSIEIVRKDDENGTKEDKETGGRPSKRPRSTEGPRSSMPLVVAPKLDESLTLIQSVDNSLDLSGDVGAVGRAKLNDGQLYLDIKGVLYSTGMNPTNTICVVSIGDDEAKVTAVTDEVMTLNSERNIFESNEVVVHGGVGETEEPTQDSLGITESGNTVKDSQPAGVSNSGATKGGSSKGKATAKKSNKKDNESSKKSSRVQTQLKF